ncbi:MAG TPA: UDP-N-acetylmuramate:L-alanyl-gamma-D-glutamyl-meso-diaminopimelate ligase, partial [Pseudomonadaceae bacterium]|nr:UDP-N-acetylmuramate:L-alanyl-gamma-D-glutamyl-meso-diaminopimelate ligase [Pseudomonadaceae bacterium]
HMAALAPSVSQASEVIWYQPPGLDWSLDSVVADSPVPARVSTDIDGIIDQVVASAEPGTRIVIMSNGGFGGIHQKMKQALEVRHG